MFKKSPSDLKTSSPVRASDRRRLKAQLAEAYRLDAEVTDLLMPDGIQVRKYKSSGGETGVIYHVPEGDPLFFTAGKDSTALIPTLYTLWKRPLLPLLTTAPIVIEKLTAGADLMIPGVVESPSDVPGLAAGDLVAIAIAGTAVPLAVGRMAVGAAGLEEGRKGKAAITLHAYRDYLWELGSKGEPLDEVKIADGEGKVGEMVEGIRKLSLVVEETPAETATTATVEEHVPPEPDVGPSLSAIEVDAILRESLVHAIAVTLSKLPVSSFPILGTTLYTAHILPNRPAGSFPDVDIKHSTFKKLAKFLKVAEKDGLIRLKDIKGETWITSVNGSHEDVQHHQTYKSMADAERKEANRKQQEEQQAQKQNRGGKTIVELYRPSGPSVAFFNAVEVKTDDLYNTVEIRTLLLRYVKEHSLVHPREREYIVLDDCLRGALLKKDEEVEFLRRDDAIERLKAKMQSWYSIQTESAPAVIKKGQLHPISVVAKTRQGKRVITLVTAFEPFGIDADDLSEELRKACASATSVSPLPGKANASEVLAQGKQLKVVEDLLIGKGIPKKWIHSEDLTGKK